MQIDHLSYKLVQLVACLCWVPQNIKSGYERLIDKRPTHRYLGAPKNPVFSQATLYRPPSTSLVHLEPRLSHDGRFYI